MSYIPTAKETNLKDSSNKQKIEAVNEAAAEYVALSAVAPSYSTSKICANCCKLGKKTFYRSKMKNVALTIIIKEKNSTVAK